MKIFFQPQDHKDGCMSACVAMILDKPYHEVYIDIHDEYQKVTCEEEEHDFIKTYLESHGLETNQDFEEDIAEGLYLVAIPVTATRSWHASLLSIYLGEAKLIDPRMFVPKTSFGFDEGTRTPECVRPILKIEWSDYANLHGEKIK